MKKLLIVLLILGAGTAFFWDEIKPFVLNGVDQIDSGKQTIDESVNDGIEVINDKKDELKEKAEEIGDNVSEGVDAVTDKANEVKEAVEDSLTKTSK